MYSFCPEGYCPVSDIVYQITEWLNADLLKNKELSNSFYYKEYLGLVKINHLNHDLIKTYIDKGMLRGAAVIKNSGNLIVFLSKDWRQCVADCDRYIGRTVLQKSCKENVVNINIKQKNEDCYPLICLYDLAIILGHIDPPSEPLEVPDGWVVKNLSKSAFVADLSFDIHVDSWMLGYAEGFKSNGKVIKRDDTIKTAHKLINCTHKDAREAYKKLPSDLRNGAPGFRNKTEESENE